MNARAVTIGPRVVETYPASAWSRIPAGVKPDDLWLIVGPQVDKHMNSHPLWEVFCAVYFEGLVHGIAAVEARNATGGAA